MVGMMMSLAACQSYSASNIPPQNEGSVQSEDQSDQQSYPDGSVKQVYATTLRECMGDEADKIIEGSNHLCPGLGCGDTMPLACSTFKMGVAHGMHAELVRTNIVNLCVIVIFGKNETISQAADLA